MLTQNKRFVAIVLGVALVLLILLIAMQFTDEVNWTGSDFVVMGILLLGTGLLCEIVMRRVTKIGYRNRHLYRYFGRHFSSSGWNLPWAYSERHLPDRNRKATKDRSCGIFSSRHQTHSSNADGIGE